MLTILIDLDNTLNNLDEHFTREWALKYTSEIDREKDWDIHKCVPESEVELSKKLIGRKGFYKEITIKEGAQKAVKRLQEMEGVEVKICTHVDHYEMEYSPSDKREWLIEKFGKEIEDKIIFVMGDNDKTVFEGHIIIDDNPNVGIGKRKPTWEVIYYKQNHNQHKQSESLIEQFTWDKIDELVELVERKMKIEKIENFN